jgi:hypothetical protein
MPPKIPIPSSASLKKCMEIITNPDAAKAFVDKLCSQLDKAKLRGKFESLIEDIKAFAAAVGKGNPSGDAWSGREPLQTSVFNNYQDAIATSSADIFANQDIRFDFAISDEAEILRGYSIDGKVIEPEEAKELDKLYNAWLAEKGILTKDGVLYEATSKGEIKQEKGKNKRISEEKIRGLISDTKSKFADYVRSKNDTIQVKTVARDAPEKNQQQTPS